MWINLTKVQAECSEDAVCHRARTLVSPVRMCWCTDCSVDRSDCKAVLLNGPHQRHRHSSALQVLDAHTAVAYQHDAVTHTDFMNSSCISTVSAVVAKHQYHWILMV